ncbi:MAG: proprotein convertase P-domain-containing protein [Phycisphaerae bacterium]|nr:proprotein convertase P-domain-containing protein [Phycisphaerae bacterium]
MSTTRLIPVGLSSVVIMLFAVIVPVKADHWISASAPAKADTPPPDSAQRPAALVAENTAAVLRFTVRTPGIRVTSFKSADGEFVRINWPDAAVFGQEGEPAIPVFRRLIVVPENAVVTASATISVEPTLIEASVLGGAFRVEPVRAPIPKLPGAADAARLAPDAAIYGADADLPTERISLSEAGMASSRRLMLVEVRPVAYNPVRQTVRVYPELAIEISFGGVAPGTTQEALPGGLDRVVLNPSPEGLPRDPGKNFLIVVANAFAGDIAEFVNAKEAQGNKVFVYIAAPGATAAQIKTYIQNQYASPENRPDFVLLIGDTNTIPNWTGGGDGAPPTDLPYTCMDGAADWYPDIAIGRFPVRSSAQLADVIEKTLYFENGPLADPTYLSRAVFMASQDNYTVSEGTHEYCITNYMDPFNIESDRLYSHTYNATTQQVRNAFNAGRLYGIYSGHGGDFEWADGPPFTQADVNGLFNAGMYSFVCSFACVTGNYTQTECFSETWLLAPHKGAAAIWASSVNSYWTEDDVLQRTLFSVLFDDYIREIGLSFNQARARYLTQMGAGSTTRRYFEMYNLMGDPSLYIVEAEAALRVSPSGEIRSAGPEGGPFAPALFEFTLRNVSDNPIEYEVAPSDWLYVQRGDSTGTLQPGESIPITIGLSPETASLPIGIHSARVSFINQTNHIGDAFRDVYLEVGRFAFSSMDVPKPILDNATAASVLNVDQQVCVGDVNVDVNITHTYIGDLLIRLQSPRGTVVALHNRTGGGTDNLVVTYDDEGLAPDGPGVLANFIRESAFGTWTLTVADQAGGDTGTLNGWTLRILPLGDICPPLAHDVSVQTSVNLPVLFELSGETESAEPLAFVIESLPQHGVILDVEAAMLVPAVPYELIDHGRLLRYRAANGYQGPDQFTYRVYDVATGSSEIATVSISVGGPQRLYQFPLDTNPGWTTTGQWQFGQPLGQGSHNPDPLAGFTGVNVYGYNLSGDYPNSMSSTLYLTTTAINCSGASDVALKFRRWLGVESATYDHANIQVSNNGSTWTNVWDHTGAALAETEWSLQSYSISAIADGRPSVYVRWGMGPTDSSITYSGWNIDDVEIWGVVPGPILGDMNCDGVLDPGDIDPFVLALLDKDAYLAVYPSCNIDLADTNADLSLSGSDVSSFVQLLLGS